MGLTTGRVWSSSDEFSFLVLIADLPLFCLIKGISGNLFGSYFDEL